MSATPTSPPAPADDPPPGRSSRPVGAVGRTLAACGFGLGLALAVGGFGMLALGDLGLAHYGWLRVHVDAGLVGLALYAVLTVVAGARRVPWPYVALAAVAPMLSVAWFVLSANFGPMEIACVVLIAVLALLGALFRRGRRRRPGLPGAGLLALGWPALAVTLATGFYLGVLRSLGTISNALNLLHAVAATVCVGVGLRFAATWLRAAPARSRAGYPAAIVAALVLGASVQAAGVLGDRFAAVTDAPPAAPGEGTAAAWVGLGELTRPAAGCGLPECHLESFQEWAVSTHRFSASNVLYRAAVEEIAAEHGWPETATCAGCHDPLVAAAGGHEGWDDPRSEAARDEGVTCVACHAVEEEPGDGAPLRLALREPTRYLPRVGAHPDRALVEEDFIYRWVRPHRASYVPEHRKSSRLCRPCHDGRTVEVAGERLRWHVDLTYESWSRSRFAAEGIGCRECHFQMFTYDLEHPPWDHHAFGLTTDVAATAPPAHRDDPRLEPVPEAARRWLAGELTVDPRRLRYLRWMLDPQVRTYEEHYLGRPVLLTWVVYATGPSPVPDAPGAVELQLRVQTASGRLGHAFPPALDGRSETWLEVEVRDAGGAPVAHLGRVEPGEPLPAGLARLGGEGAVLEPGDPVITDLPVRLPADVAGTLTLTARWRHRRAGPGVPGAASAPPLPIETLAEDTVSVDVDAGAARVPAYESVRDGGEEAGTP